MYYVDSWSVEKFLKPELFRVNFFIKILWYFKSQKGLKCHLFNKKIPIDCLIFHIWSKDETSLINWSINKRIIIKKFSTNMETSILIQIPCLLFVMKIEKNLLKNTLLFLNTIKIENIFFTISKNFYLTENKSIGAFNLKFNKNMCSCFNFSQVRKYLCTEAKFIFCFVAHFKIKSCFFLKMFMWSGDPS